MVSSYVDLFLTIIPSFLVIYLGIITYLHDRRNVTNILFALITLDTVFWSIANYVSISATDNTQILLWSRMTLFFAVPHVILFVAFIFNFPETKIRDHRLLIFLLTTMILVMATTISPFVFSGIDMSTGKAIPQAGPLIPLFAIVVLGSLLSGLFILIKKYRVAKVEEKIKWRSMMIGTCLSYFLIILTNFLFVNLYQETSYLRFGPIFMLPTIIGLGYSILKYNLMNIKSIATEVLTLIILSVSMFEVIVAQNSQELILKIILFVFYLIFSILIIRSVLNEVAQREYIEKLAGDLALTNDQLKSANEKLKELDRQKTEFVSIASHQLRSPLTAIKGYTSMLLEGSFGPIEDKAREAINRVYESSLKLVTVIEDFLNITRIELGKMKYELSVFDLGQIAETVTKDQAPNVEKKGLTLELEGNTGDHQISADSGKITQVISNLIDNSIKYTPARTDSQGGSAGNVKIKIENIPAGKSKTKENVRLTISDTGIGIDPATLKKLFDKFVRADDAGKTNISGTGLGLYVARQIVESLGGKIWAESEGKGKGSRFIIEFPRSKGEVTVSDHKIEAYTQADISAKIKS